MKLSTVMIANAVVALLFGLGDIFAPGPLLSFYGMTTDAAGILVSRLFGASLIGYALITWLARNVTGEAQQALTAALCGGFAVGFVVSLIGQLSGVVNALGWSIVVLYALFALGYGYFRFMKPGTE